MTPQTKLTELGTTTIIHWHRSQVAVGKHGWWAAAYKGGVPCYRFCSIRYREDLKWYELAVPEAGRLTSFY